jgi:dTDP-4-dehydrorhamnose 3,5-epimerase
MGDHRGQLIALESNKNIPFEIKRVYYLSGTLPGVPRGFHAHKRLNQIAICVSGKCRMLLDNGTQKEELWLNNPSNAIHIPPMVWHEMHDFSPNSVLLVLANDYYDEGDYIRNYDNYLELIKNG